MENKDFDVFQKEMENIRKKIKRISDAKRLIDRKLNQIENDEDL